MEIAELKGWEIHRLLEKKEVSCLEVLEALFNVIKENDKSIHAYLSLREKKAKEDAKKVDEKIKVGERLKPLEGIPIAVKDNISIIGEPLTCGSKILKDFISPYDATVIKKLKEEGTIFLGKTNLDEFAFGSSTENSAFGPTRNPHNLDCVPGGSSGGSAAAVAANMAILSLGSDTGGSIRQPASFCGVAGLKPTYGRVSRYGLVAFASSLDQIGPLAKDITDTAYLLQAISGYDPFDSTSANLPVPDFSKSLIPDVKGLKIGVPKEYFGEGIDKEIEERVKSGIKILSEQGAIVEEASLPSTRYGIETYYILATAEASSNLARFDGVRYSHRAKDISSIPELYRKSREEGFGREVKRRIILGTYVLSTGYYDAYYRKGQKVRTLIKEDFDRAFSKFDALIAPTSPSCAFKIGEKMDDPLKMYLSDIFTITANLGGIPGISIPYGLSSDGLPIGLQILAKPFAEEAILRIAYTLEQRLNG